MPWPASTSSPMHDGLSRPLHAPARQARRVQRMWFFDWPMSQRPWPSSGRATRSVAWRRRSTRASCALTCRTCLRAEEESRCCAKNRAVRMRPRPARPSHRRPLARCRSALQAGRRQEPPAPGPLLRARKQAHRSSPPRQVLPSAPASRHPTSAWSAMAPTVPPRSPAAPLVGRRKSAPNPAASPTSRQRRPAPKRAPHRPSGRQVL